MQEKLLSKTNIEVNMNFQRQPRCFRTTQFFVMMNVIAITLICLYVWQVEDDKCKSKLSSMVENIKSFGLCERSIINEKTFRDLTRLKLYKLDLEISRQDKVILSTCLNKVEELLNSLYEDAPTIYAITPTFARPVQKAELTRLAQTFLLVPKFHWIVVEDAANKTRLVTNLLATSLLSYTHLNVATPPNYKLGKRDPNWKKPRGVEQRNAALRWIRENLSSSHNGIVFFADDDNTYSIQIFAEMSRIKKVGVWPVGLVGGLMLEKPICDKATKKVIGFNSLWKPGRPFPVDMAGFAINLKLVLENKDSWFSFEVEGGYQESEILRQMVTREELEPLADLCTKVYVWHTRTEHPLLRTEQMLIKKGIPSNLGIEV